MLATGVWYFSVSPDGREVYFNEMQESKLLRPVRASTSEPFAPGELLLLDEGEDPDLAADGKTLIIGVVGGLGVLTRDCP